MHPLLVMSRVLRIGPRVLFEEMLLRSRPLPRETGCGRQVSSQRRVMTLSVLRSAERNLEINSQRYYCPRTSQ